MIGPGKYDDLCTLVREKTDATGVLLIVINGNKGNGFSCQVTTSDMVLVVPALLRQMADQIEADLKKGVL
jgi:hypothetical protein